MQIGTIQQLSSNPSHQIVESNKDVIQLLKQIDQKLDLLLGMFQFDEKSQLGISARQGSFVLRTQNRVGIFSEEGEELMVNFMKNNAGAIQKILNV